MLPCLPPFLLACHYLPTVLFPPTLLTPSPLSLPTLSLAQSVLLLQFRRRHNLLHMCVYLFTRCNPCLDQTLKVCCTQLTDILFTEQVYGSRLLLPLLLPTSYCSI